MKAFSVTAMNGTSYGTSKSGKPSSSAASTIGAGHGVVGEAGAEPEPGELVGGEPLDVLALGRGLGELEAGGEQQLAAGQPWRRVDDLGDVDPAHGAAGAGLARHDAHREVAEQVTQGEQRCLQSVDANVPIWPRVSPCSVPPVRLAHDRSGEGPPLVLLHGIGMSRRCGGRSCRCSPASAR